MRFSKGVLSFAICAMVFQIYQVPINAQLGPIPTEISMVTEGTAPRDLARVTDAVSEKISADLRTPIRLKWTFIPRADYRSRINLMVDSNEKMDLVLTAPWLGYGDLLARDALLPLNGLLPKYAPIYNKEFDKSLWPAVTVKGKRMVFGWNRHKAIGWGLIFLVRKDLREKYGFQPIQTYQELEKFIRVVNAREGKGTYGYVPYDENNLAKAKVYNSKTYPLSLMVSYSPTISPFDPHKPPKIGYLPPGVQENWEKVGRTAYEQTLAGIVPKEILQIHGQAQELFASGKCAVIDFNAPDWWRLTPNMQNPKWKIEPVILARNRGIDAEPFTCGFGISTTSKHPELAARFINWIVSSQDNYDLMWYGIKGKHWTLTADGRRKWLDRAGYAIDDWYLMWTKYMRLDEYAPKDAAKYYQYESNPVPNPCPGFVFDTKPVRREVERIDAIRADYLPLLQFGIVNPGPIQTEMEQQTIAAGSQRVTTECQRQMNHWWADNH